MRIAICDDEKQDLDILQTVLEEYDYKKQFQIFCFSSAADLLVEAKKIQYDIAILDIEMCSPNGYEAALQLLEQFAPPLIIFVTNSMAYTIKGYGVAFRYIPKPLNLEKISPVMDAAIRDILANRFFFSIDGTSYILQIQDIYYIEVFNHTSTLHTMDSEYSLRVCLKQVLSRLPQGYFGMPHQSYIVNFSHIKSASQQEITLTNGVRLPISRRRRADFMRQLHSYLGR